MSKPIEIRKFAMSSSTIARFMNSALAVSVFSVVAACAGQTGERRSAVDAARLCNGDANAVFAGTCLQRGASVKTGNPSTTPPLESEEEQREEELPPTGAQQSGTQPAGTQPAVAQPVEPKVEPVVQVPAVPSAPVEQGTGEGTGRPPAAAVAKARQLKITRDTFVAVAQSNVIRNCFVPAETVIVVSGEVSALNNFKKLGVNQNIAFGVTSVTYPKNFSQTCALNGEDFVYLADHAELSESR